MQICELRADAARNRDALVAAARAAFADVGLDAPLDEIARSAGVGNATLYRRFPRRADLVVAVFADRLAEHVLQVEAALEQADSWAGFASYVTEVCRMQAEDRGLADLITMRMTGAPEIDALQARAHRALRRLADRAKAEGTLRADFEPEDLVIVLMANAGLVARAHRAATPASARMAHIVLDGLRAEAATPGPTAPSRVRMARAMLHNGNAAVCPVRDAQP